MLDVNLIRKEPDKVREGVEKKGVDPKLVDDFLAVDEKWRGIVASLDELRSKQNEITDKLSAGKKDDLIEEAKKFKEKISKLEDESKGLENERNKILNDLPNIPFRDVLVGKDENENKVLRKEGKKPKFGFKVKDSFSLGEDLGIIDTKKASQVAGTRFGYLKGDAVMLQFALMRLGFEMLMKDGFVPVLPPVMIKPEVFAGMGRLAADQEQERYHFSKDDLYLVGSAEHTLGPLHMKDTLDSKDLPRRYVGYSTCFRREAGSYGKDTKGIFRVHQFDKLEMFSFVDPEKSGEEHEFMLSLQEKLMQKLELPYQVVDICTGDMGWTDAKQYDIEVWFPSEDRYRETHSCSDTTDFQARGIGAKYRKDGKTEFLHMLNATVFSQRPLLAILENYQKKDGTIEVPKVLQKDMGKKVIG
ncbi:serine--tRNA ligase [bacterium]|nr:serine--tRNA ligase [bacterium]|tara:strand:- start:1492 stop:2739 length:1248 start_codon:yes stop_codon:yes gene_type:complete